MPQVCQVWCYRVTSVVKILVPISGGKDSQACLKLAIEAHGVENVRGLFCDTQYEHPLTYAHIEKLRTLYGNVQIDTVCGGSVLDKSIKHGRFPGGGARHCTDELKIRETKMYCAELAKQQGGFQVWYGMRSDESPQRTKRYALKVSDELYAPHDVLRKKYPKYLAKMGVMFRLPILDWTAGDVFALLDGEQNPLYEWFDRVGCFPCLASGDAWKEKAFAHDAYGEYQKWRTIIVSKQIKKSIWTSKGGKKRNEDAPPCALCQI